MSTPSRTSWSRLDRHPRVLRFKLSDLTLDHVEFLAELESPFVVSRESTDPIGDLALAVFVCSQPAAEARSAIRKWWSLLFFKLWAWRCRGIDFESETKRFSDWLATQTTGPKTWSRSDQNKHHRLSAPWFVNLTASAVGELHLSLDEARTMPVRQLLQLLGALLEARGLVEIESQETADFREQVEFWFKERRQLGMTFDQYVDFKRKEAQN